MSPCDGSQSTGGTAAQNPTRARALISQSKQTEAISAAPNASNCPPPPPLSVTAAHARSSISLSPSLLLSPPASRGTGSAVTCRGRWRHGGALSRFAEPSQSGDAVAGRGEDGALRAATAPDTPRRAAPRRAGAAGAAPGLRAVTGPAAVLRVGGGGKERGERAGSGAGGPGLRPPPGGPGLARGSRGPLMVSGPGRAAPGAFPAQGVAGIRRVAPIRVLQRGPGRWGPTRARLPFVPAVLGKQQRSLRADSLSEAAA